MIVPLVSISRHNMAVGEESTAGGDLGLGPAVAYRILSLFGAAVSVANREPSGIQLTVSLRRAPPNGGDSRIV